MDNMQRGIVIFQLIIISLLFAGDEEALREDVLNDPAFQQVWAYLGKRMFPGIM